MPEIHELIGRQGSGLVYEALIGDRKPPLNYQKSIMELAKGDISEIWGRNKIKNLFQPVDIAILILFRIIFGSTLLWEVSRYFRHGWIEHYWISPSFNFSYAPFNFQPL